MKPYGMMITLLSFSINLTVAQSIQPYLLCAESTESPEIVRDKILKICEEYSFKFIGEYRPLFAPKTLIIALTSPDLQGAVKQVGGMTGVSSAWRLLIEQKDDKVQVSYPNPEYWGNAIFQDDFSKVEYTRYMAMSGKLNQLCGSVGTMVESGFGSESGISADDLRHFNLPSAGDPSIDRPAVVATFANFEEAIATIDSHFRESNLAVNSIYQVEIPDKKMKLYGFATKPESSGSVSILPAEVPANLSFLPIEVLVREGEVHMLNSQFIVPMVFPSQPSESLNDVIKYYDDVKKLLEPVLVALKE